MRILVLNEYFPPDTSATARMASFAVEALAERNQVTVLAGRPSYDPSERHGFYLWQREQKGNATVERVGSTAFHRKRMLRRLCNYFTYMALAVPRALTVPADAVLAMTDPPVAGILGAFVARLRGLPLIYNIRDLYPDMALASEILRPSAWTDAWEKLHRWALGQAARVIVLGEDMRQRIIAKGVAPERIVVIRDGTVIPDVLPPADHPVATEIRSGFEFTVLHAGNLGFYGAWESLIGAAKLLEKEGIGFVFVGDGALRPRLEAAAKECRAVRILPFRPPDQVSCVLAAGDLHIVTQKRGLEGIVVPSKLYPILAAGRPILAVAPEETDVARIVRRVGCGAVADPDHPAAIADQVRQLSRDRSRLLGMAERARKAARDYDRETQLRLFVQAIDEMAWGSQVPAAGRARARTHGESQG